MALPTFLVIGAQKCGTTSLHAYLDVHPEIEMPVGVKELDFFLAPEHGNGSRTVDWYASHWTGETPARGEVSPNYTAHPFHHGVPARAAQLLPAARLVYLVRDPLERIVAHYVHRRVHNLERRPIESALEDMREPTCGYVQRSLYMAQLDRWLEHYPPGRMLVVTSERLRDHRRQTLERVFAFLGVAADFDHPEFETEHHRAEGRRELTYAGIALGRAGGRTRLGGVLPPRLRGPLARRVRSALSREVSRPTLPPGLRARLTEILGPDVERLRRFTGDRLEEWSL